MGRPPKRNLNYSTWDVDVLENDTSIDNLIDAQGPAGFYVYFALCQKAYATDGYFYRWGYTRPHQTEGQCQAQRNAADFCPYLPHSLQPGRPSQPPHEHRPPSGSRCHCPSCMPKKQWS